jgi:hypothetical protein
MDSGAELRRFPLLNTIVYRGAEEHQILMNRLRQLSYGFIHCTQLIAIIMVKRSYLVNLKENMGVWTAITTSYQITTLKAPRVKLV